MFSFSKKKNLWQKSLSVQLTVLNFLVEEFYFTSWYNSVHSFYPSSGNCHLFLRGEIVVYFSLQLGLSWRNQVQEHFSKSQRVRMSKIDNIITYLTKTALRLEAWQWVGMQRVLSEWLTTNQKRKNVSLYFCDHKRLQTTSYGCCFF